MRWITLVAVGLVVTTTPAAGHIQPSVNENNRYLKLTPLGDRVRLAYTIYFGEVPGAALRRQMDADGNGEVSEAEADQLGRQIAAEVRPAVTLTLDGKDVRPTWTDVDVGLGTPEVRAGSFAIDLVASVCLPARGDHLLVLRDEYPLPIPGETELKVEATLGVKVERVTLGGSQILAEDVRIRGVGGPLAEGWEIKLKILDAAPAGGGECGAAATAAGAVTGRPSRWWFVLMGAIAAAIAAAVTVLVKRRGRRAAR